MLALVLTALLISAYLGQMGTGPGPTGPSLTLYLIIMGGWAGLVALWRSYFHFRKSENAPRLATWYLAALAVGCAVSITLAALALKFSHFFLAVLLASPLVAAALFAHWLRRSRAGD